MKRQDQVWISSEDLSNDPGLIQESQKEFFDVPVLNELSKDENQIPSGRRDFLKYLGFGLGAATVAAACDTPVRKALPYLTKPDAIVPGVATYYSSTFVKGADFCPVIIKTREGRPIKIEGNTMSPLSNGGTSARAQASVLDLYDVSRFKGPMMKNDSGELEATTWEDLDKTLSQQITNAAAVRILTHSHASPSVQAAIDSFSTVFPNTKVVSYDPVSSSAMLLANEKNFGERLIPGYHFDKTDLVVNFGVDFLGTWLSPVEFSNQFAKRRKIENGHADELLRLVQFESNMSYTGSNADHRIFLRPSHQGAALATLYNAIASEKGGATVTVPGNLDDATQQKVTAWATELLNHQGASIVLANSNNTAEQELVNAINVALGNYGETISFDHAFLTKSGVDKEMDDLIDEISAGQVEGLFIIGDANPVYDHPRGADLKNALGNLNCTVATSMSPNETSELCRFISPQPHYMESWNDISPKKGYYAILQPAIHPLFNTRPLQESFAAWAGLDEDGMTTYDLIKTNWEANIFPMQSEFSTFQAFWDNTLFQGYAEVEVPASEAGGTLDVGSLIALTQPSSSEDIETLFYEPIGVGAGQYSNNPWLQELPDPVTRVVWDNVLHIPVKWNGKNKFEYFNNLNEDGVLADLTIGETTLRLPVVRQFGQMEGTVSVALGYGRESGGNAAVGVGKNMFPLLTGRDSDGNIQYFVTNAQVSKKKGVDKRFASVQHHHTLGLKGPDESKGGEIINVDEKAVMTLGSGPQGGLTKRSIFRFANVSELEEAIEDLHHEREHHQHLNEQTLYPDYSEIYGNGHHWGMSVDLSACIGCGACQVACVAENNVPVVGKVEVNRHHEMTWLRIDRYYYGDVENPNVVYQPMMCQHCDNAPCENVCPVAATNHSSEGLNQMAYNRCVGTRYCANNCPYKVRRFNWLDYITADTFPLNENRIMDGEIPFYAENLTRMVLNPDVTVRSRGVIEKCSMCVQRIQEGKLRAKTELRQLKDGDIKSACQTACPTGAIVFGDQNDHDGQLHKLLTDEKNYYVLEETNVRSSIGYLMKVTNKKEDMEV